MQSNFYSGSPRYILLRQRLRRTLGANGMTVLLCLLLLVLIPACIPHKKQVVANSFGSTRYSISEKKPSARATVAQLYQAKLTDVPLPLASRPLDQYGDLKPTSQGMMLGYLTNMPLEDVRGFYGIEMEREGWRSLASLQGPEEQLIFEKPTRICIISLRQAQQGSSHEMQTVFIVTVANK